MPAGFFEHKALAPGLNHIESNMLTKQADHGRSPDDCHESETADQAMKHRKAEKRSLTFQKGHTDYRLTTWKPGNALPP